MLPAGTYIKNGLSVSPGNARLKLLLSTENTDQFHTHDGALTGGIAASSTGRIFFGNGAHIGSIEQDGSVKPYQALCARYGSIDGPVGSACFTDVGLMCMDAEDNLYITDAGLIRKATPEFTVSTIIDLHQNHGYYFKPMVEITGLATDSSNNIYFGVGFFIHDRHTEGYKVIERSIRKIDPSGKTERVAEFPLVDELRYFGKIGAMGLDAEENLYVIHGREILKRNPDGLVGVFADLGVKGAPLNDMAIDLDGTLYIADPAGAVHQITPDGTVSTLAEMDTPEALASLAYGKLAVIAKGGIYEVDVL